MIDRVNLKVRAFNSLTDVILARLRREKRVVARDVTEVVVNISNLSSVDVANYDPRGQRDAVGLHVQHWRDPLALHDVPEEQGALGEVGIGIVEDFLLTITGSLYALPDFPADVFEAAIAD